MTTQSLQIARGVNFILARDYIRSTAGSDTWNRALARLSAAHRAEWERPLLPIGTYDFAAFKALAAAAADERNATSDAALAAMYAYIADRSLSTLYKVFFRLANPAFVVGNFPKLWDRFFTAGRVHVPMAERDRARLVFTVPEVFLDWLTPACLGYSTRAVELAGGSGVTVRAGDRRKRDDGLWDVEYEVTWQE